PPSYALLSASLRHALLVRRLARNGGLTRHAIGYLLDCPFQLRIAALGERRGILGHLDIGLHAVAFGEPLTLRIEHPERRDRDVPAIGQRRRAAYPDQPSPRARANQRPQT